MIESVWIAFGCGLFIGSAVGILSMSIVSITRNRDNEDEIQRLRTTRQLLKEEIFRLEKNYKPRKPQPRHRRRKPVELKKEKVVNKI